MKNILTCSVCLSTLNIPVSLHCGHTFCRSCIQQSIQTQSYSACPLCRQPILLAHTYVDELLPEIIRLFTHSDNQEMLDQFPSLMICLDCAMTPIKPILLSCQHLFCQQCIQQYLNEELVCPACQSMQPCLTVNTNQVYNNLISWYLKESNLATDLIEEQIFTLDKINGLPVFWYDQQISINQNAQFMFIEPRYQEMIKCICAGSAHFAIVQLNNIINQTNVTHYADLVRIDQVQKTNNGFYVKVQGVSRIQLHSIYAYHQNTKIEVDQHKFQQYPQLLWLCDCVYLNDTIHSYDKISQKWDNIVSTLLALCSQMPQNLKLVFEEFNMKICRKYHEFYQIQQGSLYLLSILNMQPINILCLYYQVDIQQRLDSIEKHFEYIKQNVLQLYQQTKFQQTNNQNQLITLYPNLDISQQYFINLLQLSKIYNQK